MARPADIPEFSGGRLLANLKEADLKRVAQSFINTVNAMPATITSDQGIQDLLARWLPLARARSEAGGWAEDRKPEPEPWEYLLDPPMDS